MILSFGNTFLINFRICDKCHQSYSYSTYNNEWCQPCHSKYFQHNFCTWTSHNFEIDKFLQKIQFDANSPYKVMEWIPYNRLLVKKCIGKGGFGSVNLASWLDGPIDYWDNDYKKWKR